MIVGQVLPCHSMISGLSLLARTFTSVGSRQSLVKSLQCSCGDDEQATTVKRTIRHGDHFSRNARAVNEIVGREQFTTVSSFQGKLICTRREQC